MNLSKLLNFQANKSRLEYIRNNRINIVPFVGAGISKNCNLYTWWELLRLLGQEFLLPEETLELELKNDPILYADAIVSASGNSDMIMKRIGELVSEASVIHSEIPYLLVSSFSPMIVTTNYDTLLETAALKNKPLIPLLPCLEGQVNKAISVNDRKLLKIHGSIEEPTSFVFSSEQYRHFYGTPNNRRGRLLPLYLKKIFTARKVLFVGCSLEKDITLEILKECVVENRGMSHYAIVPYLSDNKLQIIRHRKLTSLCIEPIYYPEGDYACVNKLISYLSDENCFIYAIRKILEKVVFSIHGIEFQFEILISIIKESFYRAAAEFPELYDIDNSNYDLVREISSFISMSHQETDNIIKLCENIFAAYANFGYLPNREKVISFFNEQFKNLALQELEINPLLEKHWSINQILLNNVNYKLSNIAILSEDDINTYAKNILDKLQYQNGMDFSLIKLNYELAKQLINTASDKMDLEIKLRLMNSIGAFSHYCKDSAVGIQYLEKCIREIEEHNLQDRKWKLFEAKCYANLAITRSLSDTNILSALEAAEKDISLKKRYNESDFLLSRSLNFYATLLKEIDPLRACNIYIEVAKIKKGLITSELNDYEIKERTASWATTLFNLGLLAKDLELYELSYRIICYANELRFKTVNPCNRDYCSSINVCAEIELFIEQKHNLDYLIRAIESRVDLPPWFAQTLAHTWYICAYYYYKKNDYRTALKYINHYIKVSKEKGALVDFYQDVRAYVLLADIKYSTNSNDNQKREVIVILKDTINKIVSLYGEDSFYLILPYSRLVKLCPDSEKNGFSFYYYKLTKKYVPLINTINDELSKFVNELIVDN